MTLYCAKMSPTEVSSEIAFSRITPGLESLALAPDHLSYLDYGLLESFLPRYYCATVQYLAGPTVCLPPGTRAERP